MRNPLALAAVVAALTFAAPVRADTGSHRPSPAEQKIMDLKADPAALRHSVKQLSFERHRRNPKALERARSEIQTALERAHWTVQREPFTAAGVAGVNLRARSPGMGTAPRTWIVGAHYDTVIDSPGADDNASGVAGLIEVARLLGDGRFAHTIELVAFDLEESLHGGSEALARMMAQDQADVAGMISLEMLGFRSTAPGSQKIPAQLAKAMPRLAKELDQRKHRGDFIAAISNAGGKLWFESLVSSIREAGVPVVPIEVSGKLLAEPALRRSDHAPFWDEGFPAVVLTDTAEHRNARYHTPGDTPDTLDYDFMAGVVTGVARTVGSLAGPR